MVTADSPRESTASSSGAVPAAVGLVALHVVDDSFLQPQPGTSQPTTSSAALCRSRSSRRRGRLPRARAGVRATPHSSRLLRRLGGIEAVYYRQRGPSGDDFTGFLSIVAGVVLLAIGASRSGGRGGRRQATPPVRLDARSSPRRPPACLAGPLPGRHRLRRHARRPRGGAGAGPRRLARRRRVHDERRAQAAGLVRAVAERRDGDRLSRRPAPAARAHARAPRLRRPPLRPSRRGRERGRPEHVRVARRARPSRRRGLSPQPPTSIPSGSARSASRSAARC